MTEERATPWLYGSVPAISVGRSMENPKDIAHQETVITGVTALEMPSSLSADLTDE
jgi:hypothetical protein